MALILCPKGNAPRGRGVVRLPKRGRAGRCADQACGCGPSPVITPGLVQRFIKPRYHSWKCFMPSSMGDW